MSFIESHAKMLQRWLAPIYPHPPPTTSSGVQAIPYSGFADTGGNPLPSTLPTRHPSRTGIPTGRLWDHRTDGNILQSPDQVPYGVTSKTPTPARYLGIPSWLYNAWTGSVVQVGDFDNPPFHRRNGAALWDRSSQKGTGVKEGASPGEYFQYPTTPVCHLTMEGPPQYPSMAKETTNSPTGWVQVFLDSTDKVVGRTESGVGIPLTGYERGR